MINWKDFKFSKINIIKSIKGSTLISLMISAAITVTILWAVMDLLSFGHKSQTQFTTSMSFQQMRLTSMMVLMNPKLCKSAFEGKLLEYPLPPEPEPNYTAISDFNAIIINGQQVVPDVNTTDLTNPQIRIINVKKGIKIEGLDNKRIYIADFFLSAELNRADGTSHTFSDIIPIQFIATVNPVEASEDADVKTIEECYSSKFSCPSVGFQPPSCNPIGTPNVSIITPSNNFVIIDTTTDIEFNFSADTCSDSDSATAKIYAIFPNFSEITTIVENIAPESHLPGTAVFNHLTENSTFLFGDHQLFAEVTCNNGNDTNCSSITLVRPTPSDCSCPNGGYRPEQIKIDNNIYKGSYCNCVTCAQQNSEAQLCKANSKIHCSDDSDDPHHCIDGSSNRANLPLD
jgi:hypothetical protein